MKKSQMALVVQTQGSEQINANTDPYTWYQCETPHEFVDLLSNHLSLIYCLVERMSDSEDKKRMGRSIEVINEAIKRGRKAISEKDLRQVV